MRAVLLVAALTAVGGCGTASVGDRPDLGSDAEVAGAVDAALFIDATSPDALVCAGGDARATDPTTGHCYIYVGTAGTWAQGSAGCMALGGHLATATSASEVAILTALPTTPSTTPDVWLGGTDQVTEDSWFWLTPEVMTYTNWRTGEPNNGGVDATEEEDCMVIESDTGGSWDDRPCTRIYPALCELE